MQPLRGMIWDPRQPGGEPCLRTGGRHREPVGTGASRIGRFEPDARADAAPSAPKRGPAECHFLIRPSSAITALLAASFLSSNA